METAVKSAPMKSYMVSFRQDDKRALQFLKTMQLMDFFTVKESPYDPAYVAEIKAMNKRSFKTAQEPINPETCRC